MHFAFDGGFEVVSGFLEFVEGFSESATDFWQAFRAKHQQGDDEDDQEFRDAE